MTGATWWSYPGARTDHPQVRAGCQQHPTDEEERTMLTMTPDALAAVRRFTAHPRLDEASGVRIDERSAAASLQVRAVMEPRAGDLVIEQSGGRIFLGPGAAPRVRGKVLDARHDAAGRIEFVLKAA